MRKEPLKEESPPSPDGATKSTYAKAVIIGEDPIVDYRAERKIRLESTYVRLGGTITQRPFLLIRGYQV